MRLVHVLLPKGGDSGTIINVVSEAAEEGGELAGWCLPVHKVTLLHVIHPLGNVIEEEERAKVELWMEESYI